MNLFGLIGEYKDFMELMTDTDADDQVVQDTLEAVTGEIEVKAEGYVAVMNQLDMEIEACKKHKAEWDQKLKVRERNRDALKKHLLEGMLMLGKNELKAGDVTLKVTNAGGVLPLVFDESKTVPERFTKITIENDNKLIREALEKGENLDFVHYGERGKVLKIK
jgi:hypothetical protein